MSKRFKTPESAWILLMIIALAALVIALYPTEPDKPLPTPRATPCEPSCGNQNVACIAGTPHYDSRRPVGRMRILDYHCTAWIIAAPNIIITNAHCYPGFVIGLDVDFNYECDDCKDGAPATTDSYKVTEVLHVNEALDYVLLRVEGDPASAWGIAPVDDALPEIGQDIYEFHHSNGMPMGYDTGKVTTIDTPGGCMPDTPIELGISAVATGGGSGSPIFSAASHCVVGICHCGPPCDAGYAVPMSAILADALPFIQQVGSDVVRCDH